MPSPFVELEVGERVVRVTNPDKVFFAQRGESKLDLVRYYLAVGDGIVRALYERPTQLKRHPDGAEGEAIYQKRVPVHRPDWIETGPCPLPVGPPRRRALRHRAGARRLGCQPRDARLPSVALSARPCRAPRRAARRRRPAAGNDLRRREDGRRRRP